MTGQKSGEGKRSQVGLLFRILFLRTSGRPTGGVPLGPNSPAATSGHCLHTNELQSTGCIRLLLTPCVDPGRRMGSRMMRIINYHSYPRTSSIVSWRISSECFAFSSFPSDWSFSQLLSSPAADNRSMGKRFLPENSSEWVRLPHDLNSGHDRETLLRIQKHTVFKLALNLSSFLTTRHSFSCRFSFYLCSSSPFFIPRFWNDFVVKFFPSELNSASHTFHFDVVAVHIPQMDSLLPLLLLFTRLRVGTKMKHASSPASSSLTSVFCLLSSLFLSLSSDQHKYLWLR